MPTAEAIPLSAKRFRIVAAVFTAAVFSNAALLFVVEPMFSRMALPLLSGSPALWNTCMPFFQAALLGGYVYAHVASTRLTLRQQTMLHVALLAVSALALPVAVARNVEIPSGDAPIAWLISVLATSPELRSSCTAHPSARAGHCRLAGDATCGFQYLA
jgi:hypothetical protein